MKCSDCEYNSYCFAVLHSLNSLTEGFCRQGRRKREYKIKPITLGEVLHEKSGTDTTVEKVLPVQ